MIKNLIYFLTDTGVRSISFLTLIFLVIMELGFYMFPAERLNMYIFELLPDIRFIVFTLFVFMSIGAIISMHARRFTFTPFKPFVLFEQLIYLSTSIFFAFFFYASFSLLSRFGIYSIIVMTIIFYFLSPLCIRYLCLESISSTRPFVVTFHTLRYEIIILFSTMRLELQKLNYNEYKKNPVVYIQNSKKILTQVIILFVFIFSFSYFMYTSSQTAYSLIVKAYDHKLRLEQDPKVKKVEPRIVYPSIKVIIFGTNLGFKPDDQQLRLMSTFGEIEKDFWGDQKIIFTIPLHWKPGEITMWIEKPVRWGGKKIITKSSLFKIKLLPISQRFTPEDDEYFRQLKTLSDETLSINGYDLHSL